MRMEIVPKVSCQTYEISLTFDFLILKMQGNFVSGAEYYLHKIFPKLLGELTAQKFHSAYTVARNDLTHTPLCIPRGRWYVYPSSSAQL